MVENVEKWVVFFFWMEVVVKSLLGFLIVRKWLEKLLIGCVRERIGGLLSF